MSTPDGAARRTAPACFVAMYPHLRDIARELGYALAVHGSVARDFDLLAVPWIEQAAAPATLAEAIRAEVGGLFLDSDNLPHRKPHRRVAYLIHLGGGPYIDLSIVEPDLVEGSA